jgi:hypothetical protein
MQSWSFLTRQARVLPCIAHDPGARLRGIGASLGITDGSVHGIITELGGPGRSVASTPRRRTGILPHVFGRQRAAPSATDGLQRGWHVRCRKKLRPINQTGKVF